MVLRYGRRAECRHWRRNRRALVRVRAPESGRRAAWEHGRAGVDDSILRAYAAVTREFLWQSRRQNRTTGFGVYDLGVVDGRVYIGGGTSMEPTSTPGCSCAPTTHAGSSAVGVAATNLGLAYE